MPRLRFPRPRRRRWTRDGGAVAATVAVVLGCGVLLGMSAVVIDVGRLYVEREELQSGADAAAWAVAEDCARDATLCTPSSPTAARYAAANARDGAAAATVVCGRGGTLTACPPAPANQTACLGAEPATGPYVEVRTATRLPDGSTLLPTAFAAAFTDAVEGTEVGACARAAWGPPRVVDSVAVTFSICEWSALTGDGDSLWAPPGIATPPASAERVVLLKGEGEDSCPSGPSGWDAPGGFGWLDDPDRTCFTRVELDGWYGGDPGVGRRQECETALRAARDEQRVLFLPVYDAVTGQGTNTRYHLAGFAAFVLTGYRLTGGVGAPSWLTGRQPCAGSERCLAGYFVRTLVPTVDNQFGGPDLGVSMVRLVG